MIPDEDVQLVADAADIVAIIGEHVRLKRVGTSWRGPCPFHNGKGPNFSVQPGKGWKCFVCGESGSLFGFLQKHLGLAFPEAVKLVAARCGIEVREITRTNPDAPDWRAPHWEMHAAAAEWAARQLWDTPGAAPAREYLAGRGLGRAEAERFGLGWAPRDPAAMRAHLATLGFDAPRQLECGLLAAREGEEMRPRFRDRLLFPIHDAQGHPVGFGGRLLGPGEPKYLNSPESPVFTKGSLLYLLHAARHAIRRRDRVLVVEGYVDAIRLHLAGLEEAVAPMGTALTEDQASQLARLAPTAFLLYDSDAAGLKATFRSGLELLRHGVTVRVVTLPEGEDPDTFVAARGAAGLERLLDQAMDVFERQVQLLSDRGFLADLRGRRVAVDKLLPTVRACRDEVTRDLYLRRLSEVTGVDREILLREMDTPPRRPGGRPVGRDEGSGPSGNDVPDGPPPGAYGADGPDAPYAAEAGSEDFGTRRQGRGRFGRRGEAPGWHADRRRPVAVPAAERRELDLLRLMLHDRATIEALAEVIGEDDLATTAGRALFVALVAAPEATLEDLASAVDAEVAALVERLAAEGGGLGNRDLAVEAHLRYFRERGLQARLDEFKQSLNTAADERKHELLKEIERLKREILALRRKT